MAIDERAEHKRVLTGEIPPVDPDEITTYVQLRYYDRRERRVKSLTGRSITCQGFDPSEVYKIIQAALVDYNNKLREERDAEESAAAAQSRPRAHERAPDADRAESGEGEHDDDGRAREADGREDDPAAGDL